jgi:hypothetical protein
MNGRLEKMKTKYVASTNALLGGALLAMAGFSAPVHAIKISVDTEVDQAAEVMEILPADNHVSYAKETLSKATDKVQKAASSSDSTTYYKLEPRHRVFLTTELSREVANQTLNIVASLTGMVFTGETAVLKVGEQAAVPASRGGDDGADKALWIVTGTADIPSDTLFRMDADFAVSGSGGSLNVMVEDSGFTISGFDSTESHPLSSAVRVAPALQEMVALPSMSPEAKVDVGFLGFGGTARSLDKDASLGSIMLGVKLDLRDAQKEFNNLTDMVTVLVDTPGVGGDAAQTGITQVDDGTGAAENSVTIAGATSFIGQKGEFGLAGAADCSGTITEIRKMSTTTPSRILDDITGRKASEFTTAGMHLCVVVDGETPIPETGAYTVQTSYKGLADAAFPPAGGSHVLAAIGRNGTTFRIPYITTDAGYNQRFVIVNRGAATTYSFGEFEVEEARGVMVAAGMMASGDLPEGTTVVTASNIVDITGGSRAAGTLTIVADESTIDAAVQQVNLGNRTVDTVYLTSN